MINKNFQLALSSSRAQHEDLDEPIDLWMPVSYRPTKSYKRDKYDRGKLSSGTET